MTHLLQSNGPAAPSRAGTPVQAAKRLMNSVVTDVSGQRLVTDFEGHLDDTIASKIVEMKGLRDAVIAAWIQMLESGDDADIANELVSFFENLAPLGEWPEELNMWNDGRGDHIRFFNCELWLYLIALLVRERRWEVVRRVLNTPLCYSAKHGGYAAHGYPSLNKGLPALEHRKQRLNLDRMSLFADLVKQRADRRLLPFESLMEADFLMYLRDALAEDASPSAWYPRTLVYLGPFRSPFPVFVRWAAGRDTEGIAALLRLGDLAAVSHRLKQASESGRMRNGVFGHWDVPIAGLAGLLLRR
jgi:hypothetical protein